MSARVIVAADGVVAAITAAWNPSSPDAVSREWDPDIQASKIVGRQLYVLPYNYSRYDFESKLADFYDNTISVLTVERFTDPTPPTKDWIDARVTWVEANVFKPFADPRHVQSLWATIPALNGLWPESSEMETLCDRDYLRQHKLFFSVCTFSFREVQ